MHLPDAVYAAGLFDGEGCVYIAASRWKPNHSVKYALRCTISMTHKPTIEWLQTTFGGSFESPRAGAGYKPLYRWVVANDKAEAFLATIRPYSITKAAEIWLGLEYRAQRGTSRRGTRPTATELAIREGFKLALQEAKRG